MDELIQEIKKTNEEILTLVKKLRQYKYIDTAFLEHELGSLKKKNAELKQKLHELDLKNRR